MRYYLDATRAAQLVNVEHGCVRHGAPWPPWARRLASAARTISSRVQLSSRAEFRECDERAPLRDDPVSYNNLVNGTRKSLERAREGHTKRTYS